MIYVLLKGGLGNQLFQYQFGQYLSEHFNDAVSYCIENFRYGYCLGKVGINVPIVDSKKMNLYTSKHSAFRIFKKIFPRLTFFLLRHFGVYYWDKPNRVNLQKIKKKKDKDIYVVGYWQYNDIYTFKPIITNFNLNITGLAKYIDTIDSDSCFVHVRRGDYINDSSLFVCDKKYYLDAMNKMLSINHRTRFYIFSNDIEWCKNNFNDYNCIFVDDINNDSSEFYLLSLFENAVISNSTFSYCAINTGRYPKTVIAPKKWRNGRNAKYRDIYDSRWILI